MSTVSLPQHPNLDHLRNQARTLQRTARAGDPDAAAEVLERAPDLVDRDRLDELTLQVAQLVIARRYGFASWTRLKRHVELVVDLSREPDAVPPADDPADEFLRLACLTYGRGDGPQRWSAAREVLAAHPELVRTSIHAASATASVADVRRLLEADPSAARRPGGPHRWEPLFYLAYARHDPEIELDATRTTAELLLEAGADVNAGYLWHGLPTPFTVLTGAFGAGELGELAQPPHPHGPALARQLLEAGADPNERQGLYNRMFRAVDDHLVLLFEFGLGTETDDPWRQRLGDAVQTPTELVRDQLAWAVTHHQVHRVRLLADRGVDISSPYADGHTPVERAALANDPVIVAELVARGAPPPQLDGPEALVVAVLAADRPAVDALVAAEPDVVEEVRRVRPALVVRAAVNGGIEAVRLAVELGFDVNALGRTDVAIEQPWETALHHAAQRGDVALAEVLLELGADPSIEDQRFHATPRGWAEHFEESAVAAVLDAYAAAPG